MPKLHSRLPAVDGRATVLCYERDPSVWYYRETAAPGEYRTKKIPGATTAEEAKAKALDIYTELRNTDKLSAITGNIKVTTTKRVKKASIQLSMREHLKEQQVRADAGLIADKYIQNKEYHLRHVTDYLDTKHINYVIDIKDDTFDDYVVFRTGKTTKVNISNEVKTISQWLNWCRKKRQLKPDVAALKLTPTVSIKKEDLTANPPLSDDDWRKVEHYIRTVYVEKAEHRDRRGLYWRKCFYTFIMVARHSGMRPSEILNLRWSDLTIVSMGKRSTTDNREHLIAEINVRKTKTGDPRQVPARCGKPLKEWKEFQASYVDAYYPYSNGRIYNKDSYVFMTSSINCKPYTIELIQKTLRMIYRRLDLKGHWASDKPYTLYSLRSTFVDAMLMEDTPIAMLSLMTGHSVAVLQKHYSRLNVLRKSRELTELPIGRTKDKKEVIELWD